MSESFPFSRGITQAALATERAIDELRHGRLVVVGAPGGVSLACAAETASEHAAALLATFTKNAMPALALSATRARRMGLTSSADSPVKISSPALSVGDLIALADPLAGEKRSLHEAAIEPLDEAGRTALALATHGALLPAMVLVKAPGAAQASPGQWAPQHSMVYVRLEDAAVYPDAVAATLKPVSEATLPLAGGKEARAIAFRSSFGHAEHLAILVGEPEKQPSPLLRVHSSCLTGDIIGSLRCDCRDQLQLALGQVSEAGHGVILYMDQEGRGIGIANKLRAYRLQDGGADTVDANEALGFAADERDFRPAAEILRQLGLTRVRLMTNNPQKLEALAAFGITVTERVPLVAEPREQNKHYLATKAARCGHLL